MRNVDDTLSWQRSESVHWPTKQMGERALAAVVGTSQEVREVKCPLDVLVLGLPTAGSWSTELLATGCIWIWTEWEAPAPLLMRCRTNRLRCHLPGGCCLPRYRVFSLKHPYCASLMLCAYRKRTLSSQSWPGTDHPIYDSICVSAR
jgi:hypothetical protein